MVSESFVPANQRTSILYCRLSDFWSWKPTTARQQHYKHSGSSFFCFPKSLFVSALSCCCLKPSLSIDNFTTIHFSKLFSDLYIGVHLKGTRKFCSKLINRQFFHKETVFHIKILSIINFTTKLFSIKDYFLSGPQ